MTVQSPPGYAPPPPPPPVKKGLGPLGWILIGCGVIVILVAIFFAAAAYFVKTRVVDKISKNPAMAGAELLVRASPDLDLVSADENAQTLTIRNKKTNEVITANLDDVKNGHFKWSNDKGSGSFDMSGNNGTGSIKVTDEKGKQSSLNFGGGPPKDLPSWVPAYPGATVQGSFASTTPEARAGGFTVIAGDAPDKLIDWYESQLKAAGFTTQKATVSANGGTSGGNVTGTTADQKRTVNVAISANQKGDGSQALVTYSDKP